MKGPDSAAALSSCCNCRHKQCGQAATELSPVSPVMRYSGGSRREADRRAARRAAHARREDVHALHPSQGRVRPIQRASRCVRGSVLPQPPHFSFGRGQKVPEGAKSKAPQRAALTRLDLCGSRCAQVDLVLGETFSLTQTGGSTVHVTGWRQYLQEVVRRPRRLRFTTRDGSADVIPACSTDIRYSAICPMYSTWACRCPRCLNSLYTTYSLGGAGGNSSLPVAGWRGAPTRSHSHPRMLF